MTDWQAAERKANKLLKLNDVSELYLPEKYHYKSYQYKYCEVPCQEVFFHLTEGRSVEDMLSDYDMAVAKDKLMEEMRRYLGEIKMTRRQKKILKLYLRGMATSTIADELGVSQSSVWYDLFGRRKWRDRAKKNDAIVDKVRQRIAEENRA